MGGRGAFLNVFILNVLGWWFGPEKRNQRKGEKGVGLRVYKGSGLVYFHKDHCCKFWIFEGLVLTTFQSVSRDHSFHM